MTDYRDTMHLSAERIQAFLEGELPPREAAAVEEHASSCARCEAEVEAWSLLFSELGTLPRISPSPEFHERVLAEVQVGAPLLERLRGWLGSWTSAGARGHISPERLQDYVEGLLPVRGMARIESHLEECQRCSREAATWRELLGTLESLPALTPSAGFAGRVMANVRVPEVAPRALAPSLWDRTLVGLGGWLDSLRPLAGGTMAMVRRLRPTTPRAWAVTGGVIAAPLAVLAAAGYWVASNPLLSVGNLFTFFWWKVSETTLELGRGIAGAFLDSSMATRSYALVEQAAGSPSVLAGIVAVFCVLTVLSLYVLYRNLIATRPVEHRYVHFSF